MKKGKILETGKISELVKQAEGKVWETTVDREVYRWIQEERSMIHVKQMDGKVVVRYVGEPHPAADSVAAVPTLEDYYIFSGGQ